MEREKFSSRLGFILISAGCAIGLGNVWRFPYIVGEYGGAAFVLVYLVFLLILGLPIVVMEFAVGRASRKSAALSFDLLEPKGSKWHLTKYIAMAEYSALERCSGISGSHGTLFHSSKCEDSKNPLYHAGDYFYNLGDWVFEQFVWDLCDSYAESIG